MNNLPDKTHPYITVLPTTRSEITTFIERFRAEMEAGYVEATKIAIQLKAMEELIKQLRADKSIREMIMDEIDKETDKKFILHGATFEKSETGIKYDFSNCGSTKWEKLKQEKENADKALKEHEDVLKNLCYAKELSVVDEETGELIQPPVKTSNTYVKITLKK